MGIANDHDMRCTSTYQTDCNLAKRARSRSSYPLESVLDREPFDGGTDITRGLLDAASYIAENARRDALCCDLISAQHGIAALGFQHPMSSQSER
jgi:hypothetical protein